MKELDELEFVECGKIWEPMPVSRDGRWGETEGGERKERRVEFREVQSFRCIDVRL